MKTREHKVTLYHQYEYGDYVALIANGFSPRHIPSWGVYSMKLKTYFYGLWKKKKRPYHISNSDQVQYSNFFVLESDEFSLIKSSSFIIEKKIFL